MADSSSKPKCKYWDKCYQQSKTHKDNFLHPSDLKVAGKTASPKKSSIDLKGKKIVFTGALSRNTRKQASARAKVFGCIVTGDVSKNVDLVIVGSEAGQKADKAEAMGIKMISEDDWEEMLEIAKPVRGYKASRNNDAAVASDSDDEDFDPSPKKKSPTNKKKPRVSHDVSDSDDDNAKPAATKKRPATKPTHDMSDEESDDVPSSPALKKKKVTTETKTNSKPGPSGDGATDKRPKCKYWDKCYQSNSIHIKNFRHPLPGKSPTKSHPTSEDEEMDTGGGDRPEPKNKMEDGETIDIQSGASTYRIKRTGDHYYCTCMAWKNQNKAVDSRTCKHLRGHLGDDFESARCGGNLPAGPVRSPKQKSIPQLLLAHKWTESTNPKGWWLSEKLDGVRAYWDGESFYSRLGNEFVPPAWFTKGYPSDMELDGELFGGRGKFQSTVSIVKTPGSEKWKQLTYQIFDAPGMGGKPFEKRIEAVQEYFDDHSAATVVILDQEKCTGNQHLQEELERVEALGGEGLMIREPRSKYVNGRSHTLLKIKTFHDAEARVIGYEGGKGKNTGLVGALVCQMANGKKFNVGSGLKDADRRKPPKKGSIITYKFQELTNSGVPRFPSYVGVRADMDEPNDPVLPPKPTDG